MEGVTQGRGQHEKRLGGQNPGPRAACKGSAWPRPEKPLVVGFRHSTSHAGQTCLCCVRYFPPIKLCDGPFQTPVNGKRTGFGGKADMGLNPSLAPNSG